MNTRAPEAKQDGDCLPCDLPPFVRNNYFTGKLLTERDLTAEQRYFIDKLRLHHLALHGWGVVCGLAVKPHPNCPSLRLVVGPGLAIDACGREVRITQPVELALPKPPPPPPQEEHDWPPEEQAASSEQEEPPPHSTGNYVATRSSAPPPPYGEPMATPVKGGDRNGCSSKNGCGSGQDDHCPPQAMPITLYVCIKYSECEAELVPAIFDPCGCGDEQQANRIHERYVVEVTTEKPRNFDHICERNHDCELDDCCDLEKEMLGHCPQPHAVDCIPIAVIRDWVPGTPLTAREIDNWSCRPRLPNVELLERIVRCICKKLPHRAVTHIQDIGWTHAGEYHCHDFSRLFVGDANAPKTLEIVFDGQVRHEGLSPLTFQATVIRSHNKGEGALIEVVPAKVWASQDRTRFHLQIDHAYAERRLSNASFDLFITLRCNMILDKHGVPVDGDFQARLLGDGTYSPAMPTGNGVPGGTFESWFRVRN